MPALFARGIGKRLQVRQHEVRAARRRAQVMLVAGRRPVAQQQEVARGAHLVLHDRVDRVERGCAVVDATVAAPRLVGKQQRIGDVEVAVGGGIVAAVLLAGIAAAFDLVPGHQMRAGARRMVGAIMIHAVEGGLRFGIRAGHQRQRQHAVAMCLRDGDAGRRAAALHRLAVGVHLEEISSFAAFLHDVKALPLPVEVDQRAIELLLAHDGQAGSFPWCRAAARMAQPRPGPTGGNVRSRGRIPAKSRAECRRGPGNSLPPRLPARRSENRRPGRPRCAVLRRARRSGRPAPRRSRCRPRRCPARRRRAG